MTIARMIDLKVGITTDGKLVKVLDDGTEDEIPEDEPTILYRGRDKLAVPMMNFYRELCAKDGATDYQLRSMGQMITRFERYKESHATKQPGITEGRKWDGTPS